jgi:phage gpG-like protein
MQLEGDDVLIHKLTALERRIAAPILVLEKIGTDIQRVVGATFTGQGRRGGGSWQKLSKYEVVYKRERNLDPRILISTRHLMESYTQGAPVVTPQGITIDSDAEYGKFHQYGLGKNPKREFLVFTVQDETRWTEMMKRDLLKAYTGVKI